MIDTLTAAPIIVQIVVYVILGLCTIGLTNIGSILTYFKERKNIKSDNPHLTCPNYDNYQLIKERDEKLAEERFQAKHITKVNVQMSVMERSVDRVKKDAIDVFTSLVKGNTRDIGYYSMIMEKVEVDILKEVLGWIKFNGLLKRDELEFKRYAQETAEDILDHMITSMDSYYNSEHFSVPRIEVKKYFKDNENIDYVAEFNKALYKIREVEKEYKEK